MFAMLAFSSKYSVTASPISQYAQIKIYVTTVLCVVPHVYETWYLILGKNTDLQILRIEQWREYSDLRHTKMEKIS